MSTTWNMYSRREKSRQISELQRLLCKDLKKSNLSILIISVIMNGSLHFDFVVLPFPDTNCICAVQLDWTVAEDVWDFAWILVKEFVALKKN